LIILLKIILNNLFYKQNFVFNIKYTINLIKNLKYNFMKKVFLSIILGLGLLFVTTTETQAQLPTSSAINLQAGWSWSEGVVSLGYQFSLFEVKGGWMFCKMPGDDSGVNGPTVTILVEPEWFESGVYFSYAYNSVGYRSQVDYGSGYTDNYVAGMNILSIGYKIGSDIMYLKGDVGYGFSANGNGLSYGVVLGIPFGARY